LKRKNALKKQGRDLAMFEEDGGELYSEMSKINSKLYQYVHHCLHIKEAISILM